MGKKLSMTDVAKLSGVSIATISRVINHSGGYSVKTEEKVRRIIRDTGFVANTNAKSLRTNLSQTVGVIVPDLTNDFFSRLVREIVNSFLKKNYSVFVCDTNEDEKKEDQLFKNFIAKKVDGIIYISGHSDVSKLETMYSIPVLYMDRSPKNAANLVHSDNHQGGYLAGARLLASGCRHPVMIRDSRLISTVDQRYYGFIKALSDAGLEDEQPIFVEASVSYDGAYETIPEVLKRFPKVDGIFCSNDTMALGALHGLQDLGRKVPEEIQLIGFDGSTVTKYSRPRITTIAQDYEQMGRAACRQMLDLISGEDDFLHTVVIPVRLVEGGTTKEIQ